MGRLFQYRFPDGGLHGHSFGNLFLAALTEVTGDFERAVARVDQRARRSAAACCRRRSRTCSCTPSWRAASRWRGRAPSPRTSGGRLRVWLAPGDPQPLPQVAGGDRSGPTSSCSAPAACYTSIIPNLLIPGVREALRRTHADVRLRLQRHDAARRDRRLHRRRPRRGALPPRCRRADRRRARQRDARLRTTWPPATNARRGASRWSSTTTGSQGLGVHVVHARLAAGSNVFRHDPARLSRALLRMVR